jgi:hypothetical protein
LLKTQDCIKNEPKTNRNEPENEAGQIIENTRQPKSEAPKRTCDPADSRLAYRRRKRPCPGLSRFGLFVENPGISHPEEPAKMAESLHHPRHNAGNIRGSSSPSRRRKSGLK